MVDDTSRFGELLVVDFCRVKNVAQINWCLESYISGPRDTPIFYDGSNIASNTTTRAYNCAPHVIVAVVKLPRRLVYRSS
jgi:hypothetical protein